MSEPVAAAATRTLVIGGARSGKSRVAENLLGDAPEVTYVATAHQPGDDAEWAARVALHRDRRPSWWRTVETLDLVSELAAPGPALLIDCLTLWLTRVMDAHHAWDDARWHAGAAEAVADEVDALAQAWAATGRRAVAVTNEVGQGVVPATAAGRRFRDQMGLVNMRIAEVSDEVLWCVAGRSVRL
ncbi:bifunctional adenosylcobinamide kinase/adenosylcobinamide-phosphate guanylyltransferase [Nocardioides limicola]|uniref:bifunctional adenosylcobinamide kinase/adenosylcobinamide-phosphate guanylyltransferase n=1 Tax=Nocardioides limicola TaxID=2803368 RepID=UPI00193C13BC|nr:bifunctional adenosylcobinamide kinase/adenosylcobinamide-phosphate guanylyltransferase [Nocardioides sp. DJM-14]